MSLTVRRLASVFAVLICAVPAFADPAEFRLTFDKAALDQPFTGRVFVLLLRNDPGTVPNGISWFNPEPAFAKDVKDWKPGIPLTVGADAVSTVPLADVKPGKYYVQGGLDRDLGGGSIA